MSDHKGVIIKALTVKQPWASLIVAGIKNIENRTWRTKLRGKIYVHAGADYPYVDLTDEQEDPIRGDLRYNFIKRRFPISAIIGEIDVIDCVQNHPSVWAEQGVWNWVLANPVKYDQPILNVKGKLSLWEYRKEAICQK